MKTTLYISLNKNLVGQSNITKGTIVLMMSQT